jgi:hypothetical protein
MKSFKHAHGTRNPIMAQEEEAILLSVERALASSPNAQTIGRNGEIPFLDFLQRYLPSTLKATTGHFITPSGDISPQLDVIVADSRYPLLSENADGSALVMLHSVVHVFEIKTNITTRDIRKSLDNTRKTLALVREVEGFAANDSWSSFRAWLLAYNCAQRLNSLEDTFFSNSDPEHAYLDAILLRYHPKDRTSTGGVGGTLHLEPPFPEEGGAGPLEGGYFPCSIPSHTPLSDLYYSLVQDSYYIMRERNYSLTDIGIQFNDYMSWATVR